MFRHDDAEANKTYARALWASALAWFSDIFEGAQIGPHAGGYKRSTLKHEYLPDAPPVVNA